MDVSPFLSARSFQTISDCKRSKTKGGKNDSSTHQSYSNRKARRPAPHSPCGGLCRAHPLRHPWRYQAFLPGEVRTGDQRARIPGHTGSRHRGRRGLTDRHPRCRTGGAGHTVGRKSGRGGGRRYRRCGRCPENNEHPYPVPFQNSRGNEGKGRPRPGGVRGEMPGLSDSERLHQVYLGSGDGGILMTSQKMPTTCPSMDFLLKEQENEPTI